MIILNGTPRPSGSVLQETIFKSGPGVAEQAAMMSLHPQVFAPILASHAATGYCMPVLQPLHTEEDVRAALVVLQSYWKSSITPKDRWCSRTDYHNYVKSLPAHPIIHKAVQQLYGTTLRKASTANLHGDATLENVMLLNGMPRWIDPNPRPVPPCIELDCGKLLQSAYGYHDCPVGSADAVRSFIAKVGADVNDVFYYLATHLVRLWRYQPEHHAWAVSVAREVLL